ncbi:MAG: S8 family serine peptidase [Ekhidna sp.]|nr:S8 family serine peptidase [Ekhidna sp.]
MVKIDQAHRSYAYRGEGVIVGIIDTGIDIDHPTFKDSNGKTRILSIWDQNKSGTAPAGYNYGVEWSSTQINNRSCTHIDEKGHGTHVAGIAVGNGRSALGQTDFIGMAPEADILVVATKTSYSDYLAYYSTHIDYIIDAVNYIAAKAKGLGKPWVINMSFGLKGGPRNGSSLYERAISEFINNNNFGKGRIVVKSAGNDGYDPTNVNSTPEKREIHKIHAESNGTATKRFKIKDDQSSDQNSGLIELYYPLSSNYSVKLTSPKGRVFGPVAKGKIFASFSGGNTADGAIVIDNFFSGEDIQYKGSDAFCLITLSDYAPVDPNNPVNHLTNGTWILEVAGGSGAWDAYIVPNNLRTKVFFEDNSYSNTQLITEPGNAPNVITVGSVNSKNKWISIGLTSLVKGYPIGDISYFSSLGPTRSGLNKPEIYAPGAWVASALSSDQKPPENRQLSSNAQYVHLKGTSMAAPHVSGVVALLLEKYCVDERKNYGHKEIMQILNRTKTENNVLNAAAALAPKRIVLGIEDKVEISDYRGASPRTISPNQSNRYYAYFSDVAPLGDYVTSYNWKMEFYHAGGKYLAAQGSTGRGSKSNWYITIKETSLPNYSWTRHSDGNVKGLVSVSSIDNDGYYGHYDELGIGLRLKPNQPLILRSSVGTSSISLSYASGGASSYKVYYGTSSGSYSKSQSAGSSTSSTISGLNLTSGPIYYFAVTGTNSYGESTYSQELKVEPENITLQNQTISNGETISFSANNTIEIGGNSKTYTVNSGATVKMTSCNAITLKPGFHAKRGSNVHIFIEPCIQLNSALSNLESLEEGDSVTLEESPEPLLKVYPNPNNGTFYVDLLNEHPVLLQLTDLNGSIILERKELNNGKYYFELSNWPKGIYLLRTFDNKQKRLITEKIVHQ